MTYIVSLSPKSLIIDRNFLEGKPLIERFEKEVERTKKELRTILISRAIFSSLFVVATAATFVASLIILPELIALTVITAAVGIYVLIKKNRQINIQRRRLNCEIFQEVLFVENKGYREIDDEKIAVFKKYGHQCKQLYICENITDFAHNNKAITFKHGETLERFFNWAIEKTEFEKKELLKLLVAPSSDKYKIEKVKNISDGLTKLFKELIQSHGYILSTIEKGSTDSLIDSISGDVIKYAGILNALRPLTANPGANPVVEEENRKIEEHNNNMDDDLVIVSNDIRAKLSMKSEIVKLEAKRIKEALDCLPNLERLKLYDSFQIHDILKPCAPNPQNFPCKVHEKLDVVAKFGFRLEACEFPTIDKIWEKSFSSAFILTKMPLFKQI